MNFLPISIVRTIDSTKRPSRMLLSALSAFVFFISLPASAWVPVQKIADPEWSYFINTENVWGEWSTDPLAVCKAHVDDPREGVGVRLFARLETELTGYSCWEMFSNGMEFRASRLTPRCTTGWKAEIDADGHPAFGQAIPTCVECPPGTSPNGTYECLCPGETQYDRVEQKSCKKIVVGFFNGVWNTEKQAKDGSTALEELIGPEYQGTELRYENFYNQTGAGNGNSALQDIAEVFAQRSKELDGVLDNRWEHYWELLRGKHAEGDSLTSRLLNGLANGGTALAKLFDATFNAMLGQIFSGYSQMLSNPPTAADVADQLQKLRVLANDHYSFALIAHSQGNLFVNSAFDGLRDSHPDIKAGVVHVAPASPTLRGEHLLADIDLVINGLRVQGINSVAPNNINLPISKSDLSGHTLVTTYLDAARAAREKVKGMVQTVLGSL